MTSNNHEKKYENNFIEPIIEAYREKNPTATIVTRFPPEPNGYLHIGHAKSICLNFTMAEMYQGKCNLRFDDTNPEKENIDFVESIQKDVAWLADSAWDKVCFASDYFEALHEMAVQLIQSGHAYIDSQNAEEIRLNRGTLTKPGVESPYRNRSVDENLALFADMKAGKFTEGSHVLRAKIDMQSSNINLRDPILYRVRFGHHFRTGDAWCIYPMYDFTHGLSDMIEGVTHSLCTLEFEDHRPLYNWFLEVLDTANQPRQIEFSRLQLEYTVLSKRRLIALVESGMVNGWDDPRMPTIAGLRRRGIPAQAIREFCYKIGVNKKDAVIEMNYFDGIVRDHLNSTAERRMAVLEPIKVTLSNYPADKTELLSVQNHPQNEEFGRREVPFTQTLYIEREDFQEVAPSKFKRLKRGGEVRLRGAYVIRCDDVVKNEAGEIVELICSYDENTLGKKPEGRSVKGVIHWVSAKEGMPATVNKFDRLFTDPAPGASEDFLALVNQNSLTVLNTAVVEPSLSESEVETVYQFERLGYFAVDKDSNSNQLIFNQTVGLRDSY